MSLTSISPLIPEVKPFILSSFHLLTAIAAAFPLRPPRYARSRSNPAAESQVQHREGSLKHEHFSMDWFKEKKTQTYSMVKQNMVSMV